MEVEVRSPFPFEALPRIWRWIETFRNKVSDDFSPQTLDDFVASMAAKWSRQKSWAVYGNGELGGLITYEELTPWVGTAHFLLKPECQRQGLSVKAARLAAAEIFATERIGKLVFYPVAGNLAIGSLLVNIGAKREGTLRGHTLSGGKPIDIWVYGLDREGFENASSNHRSRNRGDQLNCGRPPIGKAEDHSDQQYNDPDAHARDAATDEPALAVLDGAHAEPVCGPGSD